MRAGGRGPRERRVPGTSLAWVKTHLAVSLGMEAIRHGFSVYFVSLPDLLDRLVQAQAENRMRRKMAHCANAAS